MCVIVNTKIYHLEGLHCRKLIGTFKCYVAPWLSGLMRQSTQGKTQGSGDLSPAWAEIDTSFTLQHVVPLFF